MEVYRFESSSQAANESTAEPTILGCSRATLDVRALAERVALGQAKVLITGESGVGKDVLARFIHAKSPRAEHRFVPVNCAGLTETILESELFGHLKGSFTGAYRDKIGKLQLAHRGTVFLDEIGEMSLRMQALLLRFLENGEIQPVGSDQGGTKVDVRVVAATNRDLQAMIATGQFREDLLYRLKVVQIVVPPLRERREDVRPLLEHALARTGRSAVFEEEAIRALERFHWPGNVRQLQNLVEQLVWVIDRTTIRLDDLPDPLRARGGSVALPVRERRRHVADDLYSGLVGGVYTFWEHVYTLFINRDITRNDIRELVRRGLAGTCGNYRAMLKLFGLPESDYKRLLNFLTTHGCTVDYREYRAGAPHQPGRPRNPLEAIASALPDRATPPLPAPAASHPRDRHVVA